VIQILVWVFFPVAMLASASGSRLAVALWTVATAVACVVFDIVSGHGLPGAVAAGVFMLSAHHVYKRTIPEQKRASREESTTHDPSC